MTAPFSCQWCQGDGRGDHAVDCAKRTTHPLDPRQRTTLASEVVTHRPTGVTRLRDVPVEVTRRNRTLVLFGSTTHGVSIVLTEGERIAFIEALGGTRA